MQTGIVGFIGKTIDLYQYRNSRDPNLPAELLIDHYYLTGFNYYISFVIGLIFNLIIIQSLYTVSSVEVAGI